MDKVALDLGFIQIYWYSLAIFCGFLVGSILIFIEAKKQKLAEDFITNLIFYSIIFGLLGARLYYVLFNLSYYLEKPLKIFAVWEGGLAIHGGIFATLIFIIYYCKKHKVNVSKLLDILVIGLIIGQAIGRWGNFFNQEAYGRITTLVKLRALHIPSFIIDNMFILGNYREPTFLYESISCFIGFIIMLFIRKFSKNLQVKTLTGFYLIWYGLTRLIIEYFRSDSLMLGPIKIAMLVSSIFIIIGITFIIKNIINKDKNNYQKTNIYLKKIKN